MKITVDVTGGMPIAVWSLYISSVAAVSSLVAFYDLHKNRSVCDVQVITKE
jgi:hypothetical protein